MTTEIYPSPCLLGLVLPCPHQARAWTPPCLPQKHSVLLISGFLPWILTPWIPSSPQSSAFPCLINHYTGRLAAAISLFWYIKISLSLYISLFSPMEKSFNTGTPGYKNLVTGGFPVSSWLPCYTQIITFICFLNVTCDVTSWHIWRLS